MLILLLLVLLPQSSELEECSNNTDQLHLVLWVRKLRPTKRNDMPSGLRFTNIFINISSKPGLETYMPPQRKTVMVWSRFVWVCFIPLVLLKYTLDSLPHIFSSCEEILQNVLCL